LGRQVLEFCRRQCGEKTVLLWGMRVKHSHVESVKAEPLRRVKKIRFSYLNGLYRIHFVAPLVSVLKTMT